MKLIISGGTGFVATELIRQSLHHKSISSLVILSRKAIKTPSDVDTAKLRQVLVEDYGTYSDDVKKELAGASACIWTVSVTPGRSKALAFDEVTRICQTCTLTGLEAIVEAGPAKPFRFIYMSGFNSQRDRSKKPFLMADYCWMRGETESQILSYIEKQGDGFAANVVRPGMISHSSTLAGSVLGPMMRMTGVVPNVSLEEVSAAMLDCVVNGTDEETLENQDLKQLGQRVLKEQAAVR